MYEANKTRVFPIMSSNILIYCSSDRFKIGIQTFFNRESNDRGVREIFLQIASIFIY